MSFSIEPADRRILILAGGFLIVLCVLAAAVSPPTAPDELGYPSSYSAGSDGAKAAYTLLVRLGYRVERWEEPPSELPAEPRGTLLILGVPTNPSSEEERQAIRRFVNGGGRVLAIGRTAATMLPEGGALDLLAEDPAWKEYPAVLPSRLTEGAPKITMAPQVRWQMSHATHLPVYSMGRNAVVVSYKAGKGQVVWWAAPTPMTNAGLPLTGNLNLFLNTVGAPREYRVLWDEYYHGQRRSLLSYLAKTPAPWAFWQICAVVLAVLLTFARRSGPRRPLVADARLSPLEFVETLGDLYQRGHAGAAAAAISFQHFRTLLTRRLGMPAQATIAQLHQASRDRLGWKQPGFYETLQQAERAARDAGVADEEALRIVQALEHYTQLLQLKRPHTKESFAWRNR